MINNIFQLYYLFFLGFMFWKILPFHVYNCERINWRLIISHVFFFRYLQYVVNFVIWTFFLPRLLNILCMRKVLIIYWKFKINHLYWKMKMSWFTEDGWSVLNEIGKQIDLFIFVLTKCPMTYVIYMRMRYNEHK